jgi:hypothetical protein
MRNKKIKKFTLTNIKLRRDSVTFFLFAYVFVGCNSHSSKTEIDRQIDSIKMESEIFKNNQELEKIKKDMRNLHEYGMESDTQYMSQAPIKILEAKSYGTQWKGTKNIVIKYQNISDKEIEAVKLHWCYTNSFGRTTEQGSGFDSKEIKGENEPIYLKPNEVWTYKGSGGYLEAGKNLAHIWTTVVYFKDKTAWYVADIK